MEKIIEAIKELILSNQAQTKAIAMQTEVMRQELKEVRELALAAKKQADASWMLAEKYTVEFNEHMKKPFWKKMLGV
jgi:hypothetical protein